MPRKYCCGSDTSRPDMGIMDRARGNGVPIGMNGFHVAMMFLLLGLLLSISNVPVASGARELATAPAAPPPYGDSQEPPIAPAPALQDPSPPPFSPPVVALAPPPPPALAPPSAVTSPPLTPPPLDSPPPAVEAFPPPPPSTNVDSGNTWNESEKAGVVIASIAALLQVAVVTFLLTKRHQMLTMVEYDDIDDLEYDNPRDPNFRNTESV